MSPALVVAACHSVLCQIDDAFAPSTFVGEWAGIALGPMRQMRWPLCFATTMRFANVGLESALGHYQCRSILAGLGGWYWLGLGFLRLRTNSGCAPYLSVLPSTYGFGPPSGPWP